MALNNGSLAMFGATCKAACWLAITSLLFGCLLTGCGETQGQRNLAQHKKWFNGQFWSEAQCTIMSAGVAVNAREWNLGPQYDRAEGQVPLAVQPDTIFFPTPGTACPGTYKCAEEKGTCLCFGVATYATNADMSVETGLLEFKSTRYQRMKSDGSIICSHDPDIGGAFTIDPSPEHDPWAAKSCWCQPAEFKQQLATKGADPGLQGCAQKALKDWDAVVGTQATMAAFRNDALYSQSTSRKEQDVLESSHAANISHEVTGGGDQHERRLLATRRRRRTLEYAPWALVKVSSDQFDSTAGERVRCAFEYGVARASFDAHEEDGYIRTAANPLVNNLGHPGDRVPCWLRDVGESGEDKCAVAMKPPEGEQKKLMLLAVNLAEGGTDAHLLIGIAGCSLILGMVVSISLVRLARKAGGSNEQTLPYSPLEG